MRPVAQQPLLLAGIHRGWPCIIPTRSGRDDIATIHDRMPVVMPPVTLPAWLEDERAAPFVYEAARTLPLRNYRVVAAVGNIRFNTPECLAPYGSHASPPSYHSYRGVSVGTGLPGCQEDSARMPC